MIRILLVIVAVGAAVVFAANHLYRAAVPIAGKARTQDMSPVELTLKPKIGSDGRPLPAPRLRLPKAYLTKPPTWSGGEHVYVDIETGLPDLAPRPAVGPIVPAGAPGHEASIRFDADGMIIDLTAAMEGAHLGWDSLDLKPGATARGIIEQPAQFGLRKAHMIPCAADHARAAQANASAPAKPCDMTRPWQEKYFLMNAAGRADMTMVCTPLWANADGRCRAILYHRGIEASVSFRRTQLERWREFVDGSKRLVDQYRIS